MSLTVWNTILSLSVIAWILVHYMYLEIRLVESVWTQVSLPNKSELAITSHSVTWNHIFSGTTGRTIAARPGAGTTITLVNLQNTQISHLKGGSITRILLVFIKQQRSVGFMQVKEQCPSKLGIAHMSTQLNILINKTKNIGQSGSTHGSTELHRVFIKNSSNRRKV